MRLKIHEKGIAYLCMHISMHSCMHTVERVQCYGQFMQVTLTNKQFGKTVAVP